MNQIYAIAHQVGVAITELSTEKVSEISALPQAQLRTAKYKKAVYIADELVFKGPYGSHDKGLVKNLMHMYAVELLEAALGLPEWQRGSLSWVFLGHTGDNQYYLAAPNVGKRSNMRFDMKSSGLEKNVLVVSRGEAVKRISEIEETELLTEGIKMAAMQHLYLRFLLDIGDSGTHNILLRENQKHDGRLIAGIDLEETRAIKVKERRLDHLFKKPPFEKHIRLYASDVYKIKPLSFDRLDSFTLERLRASGIDLARLEENIKLWERLE